MRIVSFTGAHVEQAARIARQNYEEERCFVPALPPDPNIPDLTPYADNDLGVAAFDGDTMLGFLCSVSPFQNAFGSTGATGVFSPMGATGALGENRAEVYARMYRAAGEKWARAGAASHAVCLYVHNKEINEQFFRYGFGMRCVDAIRGMEEIKAITCDDFTFTELTPEQYLEAYPLDMMLHRHCLESPFFMVKPCITESEFLEHVGTDRYFAARESGKIVAFLCVGQAGENFLRDEPGYIHADGAFCLPEYRGKGLLQMLLRFMVTKIKSEGYKYLGVDFESINPPGYAFWNKHFAAYAHTVVRRIDEGAVSQEDRGTVLLSCKASNNDISR